MAENANLSEHNAEQQLHFYVFSLLDQFIPYVGSYLVLILVWWEGKTSTADAYCKLLVRLMRSVLRVLLFCSKLAGLFGGQFASWSPWRLGSTCHMDLCPQCSAGKWRLDYRLHLLTLVTLVYMGCVAWIRWPLFFFFFLSFPY